MMFDEYLDVCVGVNNVCAIANRVCVVTDDFPNAVENCTELFQAKTHKVNLRLVELLDLV